MTAKRNLIAGEVLRHLIEQDEEFRKKWVGLVRQAAKKHDYHHFPGIFTSEEIDQANAEMKAGNVTPFR